jgi:hypothetical protein
LVRRGIGAQIFNPFKDSKNVSMNLKIIFPEATPKKWRLSIAPIAEIIAARGLPFLFVSGYGSAGKPDSFRDRPVLKKPFLISTFAAMIDAALGHSRSPRV